jgi:FAD:protein FMN transferase
LGLILALAPRTVRALAIGYCFTIVFSTGCPDRNTSAEVVQATPRIEISDGWLAMGTFFDADLHVPESDSIEARNWLRFVRGEIARLERIYSRHDPASELSLLNRSLGDSADGNEGIPVGPELEQLIEIAQHLSYETGGDFDIASGPVLDLWARAAELGAWPSVEALELRLAEADAGRRIRFEEHLVFGVHSGGRLDLDAISKGAVLDHLRQSFVTRFPDGAALLSFGQSSVTAIGKPSTDSVRNREGDGWHLVLRSRDPSRGFLGEIRLHDQSLSMSSSLGSGHTIEGRRVSHVVDPQTGHPVEGTLEAVVIADSAARADAWSTALLVSGEIPADLDSASTRGLEMWLMNESGHEFQTAAWPAVSN